MDRVLSNEMRRAYVRASQYREIVESEHVLLETIGGHLKSANSKPVKELDRRLILELVVDELIKSNPNQDFLRIKMLAAGLQYSSDPVMSMSSVLQALEDGHGSSDSVKESGAASVASKLSNDKSTKLPSRNSQNSKQTSKASKRRERDNVQDL